MSWLQSIAAARTPRPARGSCSRPPSPPFVGRFHLDSPFPSPSSPLSYSYLSPSSPLSYSISSYPFLSPTLHFILPLLLPLPFPELPILSFPLSPFLILILSNSLPLTTHPLLPSLLPLPFIPSSFPSYPILLPFFSPCLPIFFYPHPPSLPFLLPHPCIPQT